MRLPVFFAVFFSFFLFLAASFSPAFAQSQNPYTATSTDANVPQNLHTLSQSALIELLSAVNCQLSGFDMLTTSHQCLSYNPKSGKLGFAKSDQGGLLGFGAVALTNVLLPPNVHTGDYIFYLSQNFGLTKKAYAASPDGFAQLAPLTKIWIAFRNLVYLLFVLVFVVVGFAIMVRAKIDPRTVMTIENQIPKIIIALILVTFSYAICGLVIDVMWIVTYLSLNIFAGLDPSGIPIKDITANITSNPLLFVNTVGGGGLTGFLNFAMAPASAVYGIAQNITEGILNTVPVLKGIVTFIFGIPAALTCILGNLGSGLGGFFGILDGKFGDCWNGFLSSGIGFIGASIAFVVFTVALIVAVARLWFVLLKSYALFIIYVLLGPFFIMMGVLPGSKVNFDNWIRHLFAYSLVFPFAIGTLLLGKVISDVYGAGSGVNAFVPPMLGPTTSSGSALGPLIGFAIIMLLPQALQMLQDTLNAPDIKYLPGIGQMLGAGTAAYTTATSKIWERATRPRDLVRGYDEGWLRRLALGGPESLRRQFLEGRAVQPKS